MNLLAPNIKLLIDHEKLTQGKFAAKFGASRGYLESLLNGNGVLRADFANSICSYFGITYQQLTEQKLAPQDIKPTGNVKSVVEVRLEAALRENDLLRESAADLRRIISFLEKDSKG